MGGHSWAKAGPRAQRGAGWTWAGGQGTPSSLRRPLLGGPGGWFWRSWAAREGEVWDGVEGQPPRAIPSRPLQPVTVPSCGERSLQTRLVKDLGVRWPWMGPTSRDKSPYRTEKDTQTHRERPCDDGGRDCGDVATSPGTPGATRSRKRQEGPSPETPRDPGPAAP